MLSKRCKYAIHALVHMAKDPGERFLIKDISEECNIPKKFLEAILLELKRAGILGSKAGIGGGYTLRMHPKEVNLADVVRLFDGAIAALPCATYKFYQPCDECKDEEICAVRDAFLQVRNASVEMLKSKTLAELVKNEQRLMNKRAKRKAKKNSL
ncbi:MAG TPA: Rrf2 family transcriptional regulator [Chryseosolibacter sp.]|nr:Rrf2 family transcriptional regulator [Chryseosolibacter sp.]